MEYQEKINLLYAQARELGIICHFWHIDDIQERSLETINRKLEDDELDLVIDKLEDIDANIGINWEEIDIIINNVINK